MNAVSGPLFYHNEAINCRPRNSHAVIVAQLQEMYEDYGKFQLGSAMTAENDVTDPFQIIPTYNSMVNQIGMTKRDEMFVSTEIFIQINEFEAHVDSDPFIIIRRGAGSCLSLRRRHNCDSPLRDNWEVLAVDCPTMRDGRTLAETSQCTSRQCCCERSPHTPW
jgi:hypothetical protein